MSGMIEIRLKYHINSFIGTSFVISFNVIIIKHFLIVYVIQTKGNATQTNRVLNWRKGKGIVEEYRKQNNLRCNSEQVEKNYSIIKWSMQEYWELYSKFHFKELSLLHDTDQQREVALVSYLITKL